MKATEAALAGTKVHILPETHLRLAVADCLRDKNPERRTLQAIIDRLWREDPRDVTTLYDAALVGRADGGFIDVDASMNGRHGLRAERLRELRRPPLVRDRKGMTLKAIASEAGMDRETLAALMEHHGYLETVPYGRDQRRRLVTDCAFHAEFGHNVNPGVTRSPRLDGAAKSSPFPVFYPEVLASILWTLDWSGVQRSVSDAGSKRQRLSFALAEYDYLPNKGIAELCGCSARAVEKARSRYFSSGPTITSNRTFSGYPETPMSS